MSKNQFKATAMQPQCNRKLFQFNKDQYCIWQQAKLWKYMAKHTGKDGCRNQMTCYITHD